MFSLREGVSIVSHSIISIITFSGEVLRCGFEGFLEVGAAYLNSLLVITGWEGNGSDEKHFVSWGNL